MQANPDTKSRRAWWRGASATTELPWKRTTEFAKKSWSCVARKSTEPNDGNRFSDRLKLYHFTDARNVPSILEHGGVYSLQQCEELGIEIAAPGGDENSQHSDRSNGMDEYVHLCLRHEHPMEYRAKTDGRIETSIFIPVSVKVLELDGVRFVPGMSNKIGIEMYTIEEAIQKYTNRCG